MAAGDTTCMGPSKSSDNLSPPKSSHVALLLLAELRGAAEPGFVKDAKHRRRRREPFAHVLDKPRADRQARRHEMRAVSALVIGDLGAVLCSLSRYRGEPRPATIASHTCMRSTRKVETMMQMSIESEAPGRRLHSVGRRYGHVVSGRPPPRIGGGAKLVGAVPAPKDCLFYLLVMRRVAARRPPESRPS